MLTEIAARSISEGIDRIITLPIFNWDNMLAQIPMVDLYDSLRRKFGKSPVIYTAEKLQQHVKKEDIVVVTTGFYVSSGEVLESDGPVGAATLARAISIGLGAAPVMLVGENFAGSMEAVCTAAGLRTVPVDKLKASPYTIAVQGFPRDDGKAEVAAEEVMQTLNPSALISVECPDRNSKGLYHTAKGLNTSPYQAKFPILFDLAYLSNAFTVGIGDFGNEIGMSTLASALQELIPSHKDCKCGCGAGIIGSTKTHAAVIANISNWGAYGLEAALALLLQNSEIMHDPAIEMRVLKETARMGYLDPVTGLIGPTADGAPMEINADVVHMLHTMIRLPESHAFREFFS